MPERVLNRSDGPRLFQGPSSPLGAGGGAGAGAGGGRGGPIADDGEGRLARGQPRGWPQWRSGSGNVPDRENFPTGPGAAARAGTFPDRIGNTARSTERASFSGRFSRSGLQMHRHHAPLCTGRRDPGATFRLGICTRGHGWGARPRTIPPVGEPDPGRSLTVSMPLCPGARMRPRGSAVPARESGFAGRAPSLAHP